MNYLKSIMELFFDLLRLVSVYSQLQSPFFLILILTPVFFLIKLFRESR